jgi:crotonobetainyl-CoA:carnitine CoA-transferase CaiB-like acyl-CoA transferase
LHPRSAHRPDARIVPGCSGNAHPHLPLSHLCDGLDADLPGSRNDGQFGKLCELIGAHELAGDPRFVTNPQRNAHRGEPKQLLKAKLAKVDCEPLADHQVHAGVACAPIHDVPAALADRHTHHVGMVVEIGEYRGVAPPIKLSRTPAS